jgi:hypothetical protein
MPADPTSTSFGTLLTEREVDGLVVAPIERSPWGALRALRTAMGDLHREGLRPRLSWVLALSREGRIVPGRAPDAALFVLAYRVTAAA